MNVPWPDTRCILCSTEGLLTEIGHLSEEHIIPEAIGGILTCDFLCKSCNDRMGSYEAKLKEDLAIRLAVGNLKEQIPEIHKKTSTRQIFIGHSDRGTVEGHLRQNSSSGELEFQVRASKETDGSLILPNDDGRFGSRSNAAQVRQRSR